MSTVGEAWRPKHAPRQAGLVYSVCVHHVLVAATLRASYRIHRTDTQTPCSDRPSSISDNRLDWLLDTCALDTCRVAHRTWHNDACTLPEDQIPPTDPSPDT